jgi:hypothetical protein
MVVLGNFSTSEGSIDPQFYNTGRWYEMFTNDSIDVTDANANLSLKAGEYRLYTNSKIYYPYGIGQSVAVSPEVSISPNPFNEICWIEIRYPGKTDCLTEVFTLEGKLTAVLHKGLINNALNLEFAPEAPGVYILKVTTGKGSISKKIVATR